jgi:ATP-dependent exoDNAse (exonuclease V) alpha subunit
MIYMKDDQAGDDEAGDVSIGSDKPRWRLNHSSPVKDAKLVIIDECSMVDEELGRDLMSFGTKILVLGDPAQLPPVKGDGYFTEAEPDILLTEVHRQARENPIIQMSMTVREGGRLELGEYGSSRVVRRADVSQGMVRRADQLLVGMNKTRTASNNKVRRLNGRQGVFPEVGERLVCLRNNKEKNLLNGGLWTVAKIIQTTGDLIEMEITSDDIPGATNERVSVLRPFFDGTESTLTWNEVRGTEQFTFGYALTVHKSQGSQWNDVLVFDESSAFREHRARHLYTAITRAAETVTVAL